MPTDMKIIDPVARALLSAIFILAGLAKLGAPSATQAYMTAMGVSGLLLWPVIGFELSAGTLLLVGLFTRPVALFLAGFSVLTGVIFHHGFGDEIQTIMFLKNLAMTGGLLLLAKVGAPGFSIDALRAAGKPMGT